MLVYDIFEWFWFGNAAMFGLVNTMTKANRLIFQPKIPDIFGRPDRGSQQLSRKMLWALLFWSWWWYRAGFITFWRNKKTGYQRWKKSWIWFKPAGDDGSFIYQRKKLFAGANTSFFMVKHLCSTLWEVSPNAGQFKRGFCDLMPTKSLSSSDVSTGDFWRLGIFYQFIFLNVFGWSLAQHLSFLFKGFSSKTTRYVRPEKNSIHPDMDRRNEVPCRACLEPNESGLPGVQSSDVQNPDPQKVTSLWGGHVTSNAICICMYIYVKRIWSDMIWYDIWYDMIWCRWLCLEFSRLVWWYMPQFTTRNNTA